MNETISKSFFPKQIRNCCLFRPKLKQIYLKWTRTGRRLVAKTSSLWRWKKIWIKSRNAWKKNLIASAWFCRCRLYSRVASSRPKCLVLWSFFSSRICSVPSFRVSSLPKTGFIVIPHSLVANRRNKTWKLFFSTHTNKKYSSLQTNFPPKTRIKLLKKT